jgi:hypothetical protein
VKKGRQERIHIGSYMGLVAKILDMSIFSSGSGSNPSFLNGSVCVGGGV